MHPCKQLGKNQNFGNDGIELFKKLCREIQNVIIHKPYAHSKFIDLVVTDNPNNAVSYSEIISFLNNEITILNNIDFENYYSSLVYYQEFDWRRISHFNLEVN